MMYGLGSNTILMLRLCENSSWCLSQIRHPWPTLTYLYSLIYPFQVAPKRNTIKHTDCLTMIEEIRSYKRMMVRFVSVRHVFFKNNSTESHSFTRIQSAAGDGKDKCNQGYCWLLFTVYWKLWLDDGHVRLALQPHTSCCTHGGLVIALRKKDKASKQRMIESRVL